MTQKYGSKTSNAVESRASVLRPRVPQELRQISTKERRDLPSGPFLLFALLIVYCRATLSVAACNGHSSLCSRRYDEVLHAGTHNSYALSRFALPGYANQNLAIEEQLNSGVRVLLLDIYPCSPTGTSPPYCFCHESCLSLNAGEAGSTLAAILQWLGANPREIVTLLFESHIPAQSLKDVLEASGVLARAYIPPLTDAQRSDIQHDRISSPIAWDTLESMGKQGKQIVVVNDFNYEIFTENIPEPNITSPHEAMLVFSRHMFQTEWGNERESDLNCQLRYGPYEEGNLILLNHFVYQRVQSIPGVFFSRPSDARTINSARVLRTHLATCAPKRVQYIAVDWVEDGDLLAAVCEYNGVPAEVCFGGAAARPKNPPFYGDDLDWESDGPSAYSPSTFLAMLIIILPYMYYITL